MGRKKLFGSSKTSDLADHTGQGRRSDSGCQGLRWGSGTRPLLLDIENSLNPPLTQTQELQTGEHAYRIMQPFKGLIAVNEGWLKIYRNDDDGREQVLSFVTKGEIAGLEGLHGGAHTNSAIALCPTSWCLLDINDVAEAGSTQPDVLGKLLELFGVTLDRQETLAGNHATLERLAAFFLDLLERSNADTKEPLCLTPVMTRRDIANYLCMAPETLSRKVGRLVDMGLLESHGRKIKFLDVEGMKILADGMVV